VGQTFTASVTGTLTNFQFTLNRSTINSLYGAVYAWDKSKPTTLLWQSPVIYGIGSGPNGTVFSTFRPLGQTLGKARPTWRFCEQPRPGDCLPFAGCNSNSIPNLGNMAWPMCSTAALRGLQ
jgi:hypothetical protein